MKLYIHFLSSLSLIALLWPFFSFYALLAIIGGFLIDLDHLVYYYILKKDLNPLKAYAYYKKTEKRSDKKEYAQILRPLHNIETMIMISIITAIFPQLFPFCAGYVLHITLDIINEIKHYGSLRNYSLLQKYFE